MSIVKEEIERMESIGMMPFNAAEKLLIQKGYNISKSKIEALQNEVEAEKRKVKEWQEFDKQRIKLQQTLEKQNTKLKERVRELEESLNNQ